jgi:hypothetical protein
MKFSKEEKKIRCSEVHSACVESFRDGNMSFPKRIKHLTELNR